MPLVVSSELQSSGSTFVARCALVSWLIVFSGIVTPVFRSWFHLEAGLSVCPDTVVVNITESHFDQRTKEGERDAGSLENGRTGRLSSVPGMDIFAGSSPFMH